MKSVVLEDYNVTKLKEIEKPTIKDDTDVIIKITLSTICGSDVHLKEGVIASQPPYSIGHEYIGVIEEVGPAVKKFKVGDRVGGPPAPYCGTCDHCQKGWFQQCLNGGILGSGPTAGGLSGMQSEYVRMPFADTVLFKVPDEITDKQAIFISDVLSTGYFVIQNGGAVPGDYVLIFGAGPIGLAAINAAQFFSAAKIITVEPLAYRRELAKKIGATDVIDSNDDVIAKVMELTGGAGVEVAAECAGDQKAFEEAVKCCRPHGTVSVVGIGETMNIPLPDAFVKNITIKAGLGDLCNTERLTRLYEEGFVHLDDLWTHDYKLDDIEDAYKLFEARGDNVIKIAVTP
jgi:threonine dehydrogenase-like Zn-dependent dehydrogenase